MHPSDDDSPAEIRTAAGRLALTRVQVLGWIAAGCLAVVVFELTLYLAAATAFTHIDTPACAGVDTFCSPDSRPGPTGGAVVVVLGNLAAVVLGIALLVLLVLRRRSTRARAWAAPRHGVRIDPSERTGLRAVADLLSEARINRSVRGAGVRALVHVDGVGHAHDGRRI